jgi:hypothetical protein
VPLGAITRQPVGSCTGVIPFLGLVRNLQSQLFFRIRVDRKMRKDGASAVGRRPTRPGGETGRELQPDGQASSAGTLGSDAVGVAQLVELLVVVQAVGGSSPLAHPSEFSAKAGVHVLEMVGEGGSSTDSSTDRVDGDLIAVSDRASLGPRARVGGDLRYGGERPVLAPGATVAGTVSNEDWADAANGWGWVSTFAWWLAVSVSTLIVGALLVWLAPGALYAAERAVRERRGASVGWGVAIAIGVPLQRQLGHTNLGITSGL